MSKQNFLGIFFLPLIAIFLQLSVYAQKEDAAMQLDPRELDEFKENAKYIVSGLQNYFNIVGDSSTPFSEKKVIFTESWQKLFRDDKVQVEDDLDPNRKHSIYKDITAYLKDIDFFFKHAEFQFETKEIQALINDEGALFLKVDLRQKLTAIDIDGDTIHTERDRFLEIAVNRNEQDLKIVSVYSNKVDQDFNLMEWWQNLSKNWQLFFGKKILIQDSIYLSDILIQKDSFDVINDELWIDAKIDSSEKADTLYFTDELVLNQIKRITQSENLSIAGDSSLKNLDALRVFSNLRVLDISNTKIQDLSPIRHFTDLRYLNASYTLVFDISPLQYNSGLKNLNLSFSLIDELEILHRFINIEQLELSNTHPKNLNGLENLSALKELGLNNMKVPQEEYERLQYLTQLDYLKLANSNIEDLKPLEKLKNLSRLDIRGTNITDITPLASCKSLKILNLEGAPLSSLLPLLVLPNIEKIYCDNTRISKKLAYDFMSKKPGTLVIHNSSYLFSWWESLSKEWKQILTSDIEGSKPDKETLQEIASKEKIDISGRKDIESIEALRILENLTALNISNTSVRDLNPLSELRNLKFLNFSNTKIDDIRPLLLASKLEVVKLENTSVKTLSTLISKDMLRLVYADSSEVDQEEIDLLVSNNEDLIVLHQHSYYREWWVNLEEQWKQLLTKPLSFSIELSDLELFKVIFQKNLTIIGNRNLTYLEPLKKLRYLRELEISQTAVKDLNALSKLYLLEKLSIKDGPLENIEGIQKLQNLEYLDISNTSVEDLSVLEMMPNIKHLVLAGTGISNLKELSSLQNLETLDCSNTTIRNLKHIEDLPNLKTVICYNTSISSRYIDTFKAERYGVKVVYY